jgi:NAD(P)-dependent dehydrogenase (short-subunit alcohol dehydrogenase family)
MWPVPEVLVRRFEGKRVIVTGGAMGIGKATVARFASEGAVVTLTDRARDAAETTASEIAATFGTAVHAYGGDVADKSDDLAAVQFAVDRMGGVDVLVNIAGIYKPQPLEQISEADWDETLDIDLKGTFLMCQSVAPLFTAHKAGIIVNMASTNGLVAELDYCHYNAAKGGVVLLTKTLALELAPYGVRVNCVCPGYIYTETTAAMDSTEMTRDYVKFKIPLARVGTAEDVASAIAFLASPDASFITGISLVIDGGQLAF